jgi:hypothetical protein
MTWNKNPLKEKQRLYNKLACVYKYSCPLSHLHLLYSLRQRNAVSFLSMALFIFFCRLPQRHVYPLRCAVMQRLQIPGLANESVHKSDRRVFVCLISGMTRFIHGHEFIYQRYPSLCVISQNKCEWLLKPRSVFQYVDNNNNYCISLSDSNYSNFQQDVLWAVSRFALFCVCPFISRVFSHLLIIRF